MYFVIVVINHINSVECQEISMWECNCMYCYISPRSLQCCACRLNVNMWLWVGCLWWLASFLFLFLGFFYVVVARFRAPASPRSGCITSFGLIMLDGCRFGQQTNKHTKIVGNLCVFDP